MKVGNFMIRVGIPNGLYDPQVKNVIKSSFKALSRIPEWQRNSWVPDNRSGRRSKRKSSSNSNQSGVD